MVFLLLLSLFCTEFVFLGVWNVFRRGARQRRTGVVLFMIDRSQPQGQDNLIPVPVFLDLG